MKTKGNLFKRTVYVYEFIDNSVYVGLTYDIEKRDSKHKRDRRSKVFQHILKTGLTPKLTHVEYISVEEAVLVEHETVEKYRNNGYVILNIAKTGAIGGGNLKWTFDKVKIEAKKYTTKSEFMKKNNSVYSIVASNGWLNEVNNCF
jgi:predicted GIY-YIG superfamily endonuclease